MNSSLVSIPSSSPLLDRQGAPGTIYLNPKYFKDEHRKEFWNKVAKSLLKQGNWKRLYLEGIATIYRDQLAYFCASDAQFPLNKFPELLKLFEELRLYPPSCGSKFDDCPLLQQVCFWNFEKQQGLSEHLNCETEAGLTVLHAAIRIGNYDAFRCLLDRRGCSLSQNSLKRQDSLFLLALKQQCSRFAHRLLDKGFRARKASPWMSTSLLEAAIALSDDTGLIKRVCHIDKFPLSQPEGRSLIHFLAESNKHQSLQKLYGLGASFPGFTTLDLSPSMICIANSQVKGKSRTLELLEKAQAHSSVEAYQILARMLLSLSQNTREPIAIQWTASSSDRKKECLTASGEYGFRSANRALAWSRELGLMLPSLLEPKMRRELTQMLSLYASYVNYPLRKIVQRIQRGKATLIPCGNNGHRGAILFIADCLVICDGNRTPWFYQLLREQVDETVIDSLIKQMDSREGYWLKFTDDQKPPLCLRKISHCSKSAPDWLRELSRGLEWPLQKAENCSWMSLTRAVNCYFLLQDLDPKAFAQETSPMSRKEVQERSLRFQLWLRSMELFAVLELFRRQLGDLQAMNPEVHGLLWESIEQIGSAKSPHPHEHTEWYLWLQHMLESCRGKRTARNDEDMRKLFPEIRAAWRTRRSSMLDEAFASTRAELRSWKTFLIRLYQAQGWPELFSRQLLSQVQQAKRSLQDFAQKTA